MTKQCRLLHDVHIYREQADDTTVIEAGKVCLALYHSLQSDNWVIYDPEFDEATMVWDEFIEIMEGDVNEY